MNGIRVMIYEPAGGVRTGGEELLSAAPQQQGAWMWADFEGVDKKREAELLQKYFGLMPLAIQDAQRERHPPKHELFEEFLFMLVRELREPDKPGEDPGFTHLAMFVAENFLVTRRDHASPAIEDTWKNTSAEEVEQGPAHTVYRICRQIVDRYTPFVIEMEEKLGLLEDRMFERPGDDILVDLADYNRILKKLRRTLAYQHDMTRDIARSTEGVMMLFDDHEFNDIYENMERLASLSQLNQELAIDLLNTYLSIASHRLNQIMRVLTIATVIFLPLGLLAGIYGMNFAYMPELQWRYSYFVVVGLMLTVVVTLVTVLKRKNWL